MGWLSGHGAHPPDRVRILSRNGNDWTSRFPSIATAAEKMRPATMILDDEAVVLDEQGRSDFGLLQHALGGRPSRRGNMTAERWMRFYPSDCSETPPCAHAAMARAASG
ncbi:hypothetical protein [Sinorhizobium meliloti]|uniref:ATP-dependent DNA ligase n=1 Tax=Rhizobium meliloti TaxID=382 RepID=UPI003B3A5697